MTAEPPASPTTTPAADVHVDLPLVARLLASQHPDLAHLPLRALDAGWDNAMFALGDALAVRLPRRQVAAGLIEHEQVWLPGLAARLPLPVPVPLRVGVPQHGFPWRWSVVPWLGGATADQAPLDSGEAPRLAAFLRALHMPAPADAPRNPVRGVALGERRTVVEDRLERLRGHRLLTDAVNRAWTDALAAPPATRSCWLHGDLHPRNVLVDGGRLSAVIDWGDICAGDPATDLAAVWMLFADARARAAACASYGGSTDDWRRARGWAVSFGSVMLETGLADHPAHAAIGAATLERVAADSGAGQRPTTPAIPPPPDRRGS